MRPRTWRSRRAGAAWPCTDLRETLETSNGPLPVEFLAALERIGDASCLEPIASAYATAPAEGDWWREHLAHAFRAIAARERVTRRHAAMKKIARRWPEALLALEARGSRLEARGWGRFVATMRHGSRRTGALHRKAGDSTGTIPVSQVQEDRRVQHPVGAAVEEGQVAARRRRRRPRQVRQAARLPAPAGR